MEPSKNNETLSLLNKIASIQDRFVQLVDRVIPAGGDDEESDERDQEPNTSTLRSLLHDFLIFSPHQSSYTKINPQLSPELVPTYREAHSVPRDLLDVHGGLQDSLFEPIGFEHVRLKKGSFWSNQIQKTINSTFPAMYKQLVDTKRIAYLTEPWITGKPFKPNKYDESDITKFIEACSYALIMLSTNQHLESSYDLASWVDLCIESLNKAQHSDGYLCRYIDWIEAGAESSDEKMKSKRWNNLRDLHELYNAGHLLEAAIAHRQLCKLNLAESRLMDVSLKQLDLIYNTFSTSSASSSFSGGYPGHQEIEIGLLRLFEETRDEKWLSLATDFIEERGKGGKGDVPFKRKPDGIPGNARDKVGKPSVDEGGVTNVDNEWVEVDGSSLAGDEVVRKKGEHYYDFEMRKRGRNASEDDSWWNMPWQDSYWYMQAQSPIRDQDQVRGHSVRVGYWLTAATDLARLTGDASLYGAVTKLLGSLNRKTYVTGGIGSQGDWEGFDDRDYWLPNCAGEIYQETCAAISVVFLMKRLLRVDLNSKFSDRLEWTLYNAVLPGISEDGTSFFYDNPLEKFSQPDIKRASWFTCSCCPPNVSRLTCSIGGYAYSISKMDASHTTVVVHLYMASEINLPGGGKMVVSTNYPYEGEIKISFIGLPMAKKIGLLLRIPSWVDNEFAILQDGYPMLVEPDVIKGYLSLPPSHYNSLSLNFQMEIQQIHPHPLVHQNTNKTCFSRGPILYCVEGCDNKVDLRSLRIPQDGLSHVKLKKTTEGMVVFAGIGKQVLENGEVVDAVIHFKPYLNWGNREEGDLITWIPRHFS